MIKERYNIHVHVNERHIRDGMRMDCNNCAISLAINECLKSEFRAAVAKVRQSVISIELHDKWGREIPQYMIKMDVPSINFTNKFDRGEKVEPFVFVLYQVPSRMICGLKD